MKEAQQNLNPDNLNPKSALAQARAAVGPSGVEGRRSFAGYEEFFTFYLGEHSDPRNRAMHVAGTVLGLGTIIVPFVIGHPWYALLWPVVAYSFAWTGHFLIEGNKPATFGHPFWSFISDFRMLGLMLTGRLKARMADATLRRSQ